jgi:23S rRNA pseudouridine1911/1915/1917 synthase
MEINHNDLQVLHEDNHVIVVNKRPSDIVQGDKTGDVTMPDQIKEFLRVKYNKPGNIFCGVVHRLDRPTSGAVVFAKTSKALTRLNEQFREKDTQKVYWAVVEKAPQSNTGHLENFLLKNEKQNKAYLHQKEVSGSKKAILDYRVLAQSDKYTLVEVTLHTGRHHQIRAQMAHIGCIIKGDLKYGAKRSNADGSIHLHARYLSFIHPTTKETIQITAPVPDDSLWKWFENNQKK